MPRIDTTSGLECAAPRMTFVRYRGTLRSAVMWRTGIPSSSSAHSKVKLHPMTSSPARQDRPRRRWHRSPHPQLAIPPNPVERQIDPQVCSRRDRRLGGAIQYRGVGTAGLVCELLKVGGVGTGQVMRLFCAYPCDSPAVGRAGERNACRACSEVTTR